MPAQRDYASLHGASTPMVETRRVTDAPSITDRISAVSGMFALGAAGFAALYAKKAWETEHARDLATEKSSLASQAARVVALPAVGKAWQEISDRDGFRFSTPTVRILNNSELPVYDVEIDHPVPKSRAGHNPAEINERGRYWRGIAAPGEIDVTLDYADIEDDLVTETLKAKVRTGVQIDDEMDMGPIYSEWMVAGRPAIRFTDAAGRRWLRSRSGELTQCDQGRAN